MIYVHSQSSPKEVWEYMGLHQIIAPQNTKKNDPRSCAGATAETEPSYKYWRNMKFITDVDRPIPQTVTSSLEDDEVSFMARVMVIRSIWTCLPTKIFNRTPSWKSCCLWQAIFFHHIHMLWIWIQISLRSYDVYLCINRLVFNKNRKCPVLPLSF